MNDLMLEILELSDTKQANIYRNYLLEIGISPYYLEDFYKVFASGLKDLFTFVIRDQDFCFLIPGYKRHIRGFEDYFDFISPYGYSGPLISKGTTREFIVSAWTQIEDYFFKNHIVSCFLRLSLDNDAKFFPGLIQPTMLNIKGRIIEETEQWHQYENKVRKNVKRARSNDLDFAIKRGNEVTLNDLQDFHSIYVQTMTRTNVANSFFYPLSAFDDFARNAGDYCCFSFIYDLGVAVSCELTLNSSDCMFSFLGGTLEQSFEKRPNDLLKHELINWGRENGFKYFILGGGFGADDGIFRYKKSFFPNDIVNYNTGRWIINETKYDEILSYWKNINHNSDLEVKDFFPEYRKYF